MDGKSGFGQQVDSFRQARHDLEASVLPLATSVDGRRFTFQASLHGLELQSGGYAVLDDGGTPRLGQVISLELQVQLGAELTLPAATHGGPEARTEVPIRLAQGEGLIVDGAAFAEAAFSFVPPSLIAHSVTFRQGEGLIAGKISPQPALLRFDKRISEEGGADVPATWAAPR
jgi:hypothetical protein